MRANIPNWIWPSEVAKAPGFGARLGRIVHWLGAIISALLAVAFLYGIAMLVITKDTTDMYLSTSLVCALVAIVTFGLSRIARYLFAGE